MWQLQAQDGEVAEGAGVAFGSRICAKRVMRAWLNRVAAAVEAAGLNIVEVASGIAEVGWGPAPEDEEAAAGSRT